MPAAALAKRSGAARYPSRHPVIANALLKPFTVSVRGRMPGGRWGPQRQDQVNPHLLRDGCATTAG